MSPWGNVDRDKYMTRKEAAEYLGVPFERMKPMLDRGALKGLQRGKVWYIERESAKNRKRQGGY